MEITEITFQQLVGAVAVILVLLGVYKSIMEAIKIHREEKHFRDSPVEQLKERVNRHDELLQKDKDRLDAMESRMHDMGEQSTIMLRGVLALLSHEINGNSTDKLKDSMTEINDYLIRRK